MRLYHRIPCAQCPWRKRSVAGWLGGHPAEYYADAVSENEIPACHLRDHGPDSDNTAFCVGSLACARNACIMPYDPEAAAARELVEGREEVFGHPRLFYEHHTGRGYTIPLLRRLGVVSAAG